MRIKLLSVGHKMPNWVEQGYTEYAKRIPKDLNFELIEIPFAGKRDKHADISRIMQKESAQILKHIAPQDQCIALAVDGKPWSTEQLSQQLSQWQQQGQNIALIIGGPEGIDEACYQRANQRWSLSPLTLPHPVVRIVVAEQIYRAWSILANHPYHRG